MGSAECRVPQAAWGCHYGTSETPSWSLQQWQISANGTALQDEMRCSPKSPEDPPGQHPPRHTMWSPWAGRTLGDACPGSPPPQRRHRARSLPVPRGRTATGGCFTKFALSAIKKKERFGAERAHSLLLSMSLLGWSPRWGEPGGDAVGPALARGILGTWGRLPGMRADDALLELLPTHLCSPGSSPPCRPLRRPGRGNPECPERSSAWRKPGETRGDMGEQGPAGGGRGSAAASPYPGAGPPRSRLYTWRGLSR